ncbi:MAG: hypothetical protein ACYC4Q_03815 [Victivallaceae bacterium]
MKFLLTTLVIFSTIAGFVLFMHYYYRIDRKATASQIEAYYESAYAGKAAVTCKHTGILSGSRTKFNWLTEVTFVSNRDTVLNDPVLGKIELRKSIPLTFPVTFIFTRTSGSTWIQFRILPGMVR